MKRFFLPFLLSAAFIVLGCNSNHETLLLLGNVITMDQDTPSAEAVFAKDGIIKFVGSADEARKLCNARTVVKDYGTASIYPGFMESHAHGIGVASRVLQADLSTVNAQEGTTMDDFVQAMKKYMEENPGLPNFRLPMLMARWFTKNSFDIFTC